MTGERHPTPAERLLALLADEPALETIPADEVRADLAAIGIDPSRCVAFARALAGGTGSPGGRLLGAIDRAENEAGEIDRLESADIENVRAQIPGGSAAAIAAEARRQAGGESNVVAMKRRSRVLRWGGPVAGIAASVLVVVVSIRILDAEFPEILGTTDHFSGGETDGGAPVEYGDDVVAEKTAPEPSVTAPQATAPEEQAARADEESASFARDAPADLKTLERGFEPETRELTDRLAKQERREAEAPAPAAPSSGVVENLNDEPAPGFRESDDRLRAGGAGTTPGGAAPESERLLAKPDAGRVVTGGPAAVAAMVIVDPSQVPLAVQSQAIPQPDLAARVDEARRLAGDRPVIALYRIAGPAGRRDFAQVPLEAAMTQQMPAPMPLTRLLGADASEFDFLALPPE